MLAPCPASASSAKLLLFPSQLTASLPVIDFNSGSFPGSCYVSVCLFSLVHIPELGTEGLKGGFGNSIPQTDVAWPLLRRSPQPPALLVLPVPCTRVPQVTPRAGNISNSDTVARKGRSSGQPSISPGSAPALWTLLPSLPQPLNSASGQSGSGGGGNKNSILSGKRTNVVVSP